MTAWKPHPLASPPEHELDLRPGDQVRSISEVPGVPIGTTGRVLLANGFNWHRYRILFGNGVEIGDLDQRHLEPVGRAAKRAAKQAKS